MPCVALQACRVRGADSSVSFVVGYTVPRAAGIVGSTLLHGRPVQTPDRPGKELRGFRSSGCLQAKPQDGKLPTFAGSDVPRVNVGIFGRMNAGKSTLVNTLTRQETSIVDATPGTTADTKVVDKGCR